MALEAPALPAILFVILTVAFSHSVLAQTASSPGDGPSDDYVVSAGDVLDITVWGYEDLRATVIVREDGKISFTSLIEEVTAAGLTVPGLQEVLTEKLSYYLKSPKVTVSVREARLSRVNVIGSVRSPGIFSFRGKPGLIDAIAAAGGETPEADLTCVRITRKAGSAANHVGATGQGAAPGQGPAIVDLHMVLAGTVDSSTYILFDGDTVFIPKALAVKVMGMVREPGTYYLERGARLMDAVARAGDVLPQGDSGKVSVSSGQVTRRVSLARAVLAPDGEDNVPLKDGDIIHVPEALRTISVLGEVAKPGIYPVGPDTRVFDAIAAAGGPGVNGDTSCVQVTRGAGQAARVFEVDLERSGKNASAATTTTATATNPPSPVLDGTFSLEPGDVVCVPRAIEVQVLGQVRSPGTYRLRARSRLVDAIARAGGPAESADTARVSLTRASGDGAGVKALDLDAILKGARPADDIVLQDQDIISVPELIQEVSVLGEVARPGTYRIHSETRVLDVLALAGGVRPEGDATGTVLTSRSPSGELRRVIDLDSLQAAGGGERNYIVRNGDVLYVPRAIAVMVLGRVRAPGTYTLRAAARLMDAVSRAGGIAEDGDPTAATITRQGEATPVETVDIRAVMAGATDRNVPLQDGDIIFVPELVREVSVLGEVARPGVYPIREGTTLLEALAMAGGVAQMGDDSAIRLTTRAADGASRVFEISVDRPSGAGDASACALRGGEVVYVPRAIAVQVVGEVGRPGLYHLKARSCISDAIALAGGLTEDADGSSVTLTTRTKAGSSSQVEGRVYLLDIDRILTGADPAANRVLRDQDTIFVPKAQREVVVVGEVERPGIYKLRQGARLLDAIALAGGPTKRAGLEAVCVFRNGQVAAGEQVVLGRDNLFFTGKAEENPPVVGGDIVYVPATSRIEWDKVFSFLSGLKLIKDLFAR